MASKPNRIGFISTRLAGTDGVSLEAAKWVKVLTGQGFQCFFFAGESEWPAERTYLMPEAHFNHPEIKALNVDLFDDYLRKPETSRKVAELKEHLKIGLYKFIRQFKPEALIVENALSLPMNVPLGLALTEVIAETNLPTIAHHHDFGWERTRYAISAADDYLRAAFPPTLKSILHVVINSYAETELAIRTGIQSMIIPNVMDFETPPPQPDEYTETLRPELGIHPDEHLLLQPTRVVPRKRIELAIELVKRLDMEAVLLITHHSGDEGSAYEDYLRRYAELLDARVLFAGKRFAPFRGESWGGERVYALADAYQVADLITYPSYIEGFGNAFLETVYFRRPVIASTYKIFKTDIQPKGFKFIAFEDFIHAGAVEQVREILCQSELAAEMVEHNYELAKRHYSYTVLERKLALLMSNISGI